MTQTVTAPAVQTSNPERKVPTRRMSFEKSMRDLPRAFAADGDLISCHVIMALSSVFPDGEDYFVRSVRHYRDRITDPALKRQVAGFIGQEAVHGREHRVFNDRLAELGYPTKKYERFTNAGLRFRERILPPISNLAATAALEHFTATLAELVLQSEEIRALTYVPTQVMVMDRELAVVPRAPVDSSLGAIFIRERTIVELLVYMFDHLWSTAIPVFSLLNSLSSRISQ